MEERKDVGILAMDIYFPEFPPTCVHQDSGNTDIEGVDSSNACYGGTAALLNCVNWVESKSWDGRYGLVIAQIARFVYAEGPARSTGAAAAIAMLIGPDAHISFERKYKASHMAHVYDFYKPDLASEYPVVDGKLSQTCYLMALDSCYRQFYTNLCRRVSLDFSSTISCAVTVDNDAKEKLLPFANLTSQESYQSRDLEKASQQVAKHFYDIKVQPSTLLPKQIGNMYTASLYAALASLIYNKHNSLAGQRVIMFSYGNGLTSTLFSLRLHEGQHPLSLANVASVLDVTAKLESRHVTSPEKFVETLKLMEHRYGAKDFETSKDTSLLPPGTFYLTKVDSMYRRF
ncbi:unnamed protein product [Urochloa decumbens]|uniref:HMG-CoA synthase n=1 Tax=Urochloa decumbens TaxID=240449 RepID=A0ABC9C3U9_9POAL